MLAQPRLNLWDEFIALEIDLGGRNTYSKFMKENSPMAQRCVNGESPSNQTTRRANA